MNPSACVPTFAPSLNPTSYAAIVNTLAIFPNATSVVNGAPTAREVGFQTAHENYVLARFDYNISDKDAVFVRYISDRSNLIEPFGGGAFGGGPIPFWPEADVSKMQFATAEWRRIISPRIVNSTRVSFSRPATTEHTGQTAPEGLINGQDPLQFFPGSGRQDGIPNIAGLSGLGGALQLPFATIQNRYTEADDVAITLGAHALRFGTSLSRLQSNTYDPFFQGAEWNFNGLQQFLTGVPTVLLYVPLGSYANRDFRSIEFMPYFQDDWKVTKKLTLNLGFRWEFSTNPVELRNLLNTVVNIATAAPPDLLTHVSHVTATNPAWRNYDPRFGFAYDLSSDHKTAIRGGFGIFREPIAAYDFAPGYWTTTPWQITLGLPLPFLPPLTYPTIPAAGIVGAPSSTPGFSYNVSNTPYLMQYNLNVQREIASGTVLTVGYVGSKGVHLGTLPQANPPTVCLASEGPHCPDPTYANGFSAFGPGGQGGYLGYGTPGNVKSNPLLNPNLGEFENFTTTAWSNYHSLQASVNRRFSRNVQGQLSYTWSRCMDDSGSFASFGENTTAGYTNPYNASSDKAPCGYDINHVVRVNGLVAIPLHGNMLVEGWQISGILSANTGLPLNILDGYDEATGGSPVPLTVRPNLNPGFSNNPIVGNVNEWFNPAAFSLQAPGTFGNLGRDTVRGPSFFDTDFALLKDTKLTKISETLDVQFRAEFFNIFNHTNFGLPAASLFLGGGVPNPTAGQITTIVGTPRQIQFGVKIIF